MKNILHLAELMAVTVSAFTFIMEDMDIYYGGHMEGLYNQCSATKCTDHSGCSLCRSLM